MKRSRLMGLVGMLAALMILIGSGMAQANISYGSAIIGKLDAATPFAAFSFSGAEGDLVTVRVVSLEPGFSPSLSINSPIGQQIAFGASDLTAATIGNVRADVVLPQAGTYSMQIGSADGSQGQFLVRVDGLPTQNALVLAPSTTLTPINFLPTQSIQVAGFSATPDSSLQLIAQAEGTAFSVAIHREDGTLVGVVGTDDGSAATFNIPAGDSNYYAIISNRQRDETPVEIGLSTSDSSTIPSSSSDSTSSSSDTSSSTDTTTPPDSNVCTITTGGGGTNLRTGPGTNYNIITGLPANTTYNVTGQNSGWYTINYNGAQGWLAGSVTTLNGPCNAVPAVAAPPPPTQPEQPADPVATEEASTEPTATGPTSVPSPTQAAPPPTTEPTPTESVAVAPPDSAYFVEVSIKNGQATVADAVSYPGGDTEDEIFWDAVDFDSVTTSGNVQFIISCSGEGQSNVTFTMARATYSCGDVFDRFVTNDSDSGLIRVNATGGNNILVNWTIRLIGSN